MNICVKSFFAVLLLSGVVNTETFSLISWNILGPKTQDVTEFGFTKGDYSRLDKILEKLNTVQADLICLQEVDNFALGKFTEELKHNYQLVCHQRKGENGGVVVYAKKATFNVDKKFDFALPGSNPQYPGAAAGGIVTFRENGAPLLVGSVHISRPNNARGKPEGDLQWTALLDQLKCPVVPMIFAGDFNTFYSEVKNQTIPLLSQLCKRPFYMFEHKSFTVINSEGKFAGIDHVVYSELGRPIPIASFVGELEYVKDEVETATAFLTHLFVPIQDLYPSDHLPVHVTFKLPQVAGAVAPVAGAAQVRRPMHTVDTFMLGKCLDMVKDLADRSVRR